MTNPPPDDVDRTQEFERPSSYSTPAPADWTQPQPAQVQPQPQPGPQPGGSAEPGIAPEAPSGPFGAPLRVERHYNEFVPALIAAVVGGTLVAFASWASNGGHLPTDRLLALVVTAGFPGDYAHGGASGAKAVTAAAVGAGVTAGIVLVLMLLAGATARRASARGLLFLAGWGAVAPAVFVAHLIGTAIITGLAPSELSLSSSLVYAGTWAAATGWIVGLAAALFRFGRRTMPARFCQDRPPPHSKRV